MQGNTLRVVVDTNIWISFLIGKSLNGLSKAIINNQIIVLFSDDLFRELIRPLAELRLGWRNRGLSSSKTNFKVINSSNQITT